MFALLKNFFNKDKDYEESIKIFEEQTKVEYDSTIGLSFKVLSLMQSRLIDLKPFESFVNLEMLNLSNNLIEDITSLQKLNNLKIIDLRFNKIKELPPWLFEFGIEVYWKREDYIQEGIFLEGNPLEKTEIERLKAQVIDRKPTLVLPNLFQKSSELETLIEDDITLNSLIPTPKESLNLEQPIIKPTVEEVEIEQLKPLLTQKINILYPNFNSSSFFIDFSKNSDFIIDEHSGMRLNMELFQYDKMDNIIQKESYLSRNLEYVLLILKDDKCCHHPRLLESISKDHPNSKIFLVIENIDNRVSNRINFFKTYKKSLNIIDTFHNIEHKSNQEIIEKIYQKIRVSPEVNSLWRESWIELKDEIETKKSLTDIEYMNLAQRYNINNNLLEIIFKTLKKVGSIKKND
jgi:ribosomal protein S25